MGQISWNDVLVENGFEEHEDERFRVKRDGELAWIFSSHPLSKDFKELHYGTLDIKQPAQFLVTHAFPNDDRQKKRLVKIMASIKRKHSSMVHDYLTEK